MIYLVLCLCVGFSCSINKPSNFTLLYNGENTSLNELINIDGCYFDSIDYNVIPFYKDGLSISASFGVLNKDKSKEQILSLFKKGDWAKQMGKGSKTIYGRYVLEGKKILNQNIYYMFPQGSFISSSEYNILSENELYSPTNNRYYQYVHLDDRMDSTNWLLKKKWFWSKEAWKNRENK